MARGRFNRHVFSQTADPLVVRHVIFLMPVLPMLSTNRRKVRLKRASLTPPPADPLLPRCCRNGSTPSATIHRAAPQPAPPLRRGATGRCGAAALGYGPAKGKPS